MLNYEEEFNNGVAGNNMCRADVIQVAGSIAKNLTDEEISLALELYPSIALEDPTASWVEIMEQSIYGAINA